MRLQRTTRRSLSSGSRTRKLPRGIQSVAFLLRSWLGCVGVRSSQTTVECQACEGAPRHTVSKELRKPVSWTFDHSRRLIAVAVLTTTHNRFHQCLSRRSRVPDFVPDPALKLKSGMISQDLRNNSGAYQSSLVGWSYSSFFGWSIGRADGGGPKFDSRSSSFILLPKETFFECGMQHKVTEIIIQVCSSPLVDSASHRT